MFPARAKRLYELFVKFNSFEEFPPGEIEKLEKQVFRKPLATVWQETRDFYINILHNQEKVDRAVWLKLLLKLPEVCTKLLKKCAKHFKTCIKVFKKYTKDWKVCTKLFIDRIRNFTTNIIIS